jgi:hypothetical protein
MKSTIRFLLFILLLVPLQPINADWGTKQNVITLTADQVDSADDIEAAIIRATAQGARPGMVILDGRNGAIVFTGEDRSLNIFVSNLTLRGVNQAMVENCDDGLFFDDFPLKNILVEKIAFFCTGDGVDGIETGGPFEYVTLRHNIFRAGLTGINIGGAANHWSITEDVIMADHYGIRMTGAIKVVITNNHIAGDVGISLLQCTQLQVRKNAIHASYQGVQLVQESWENMVQMNTVLGVSHSGIMLETGVTRNRILANRVICAPGVSCLTVDATPEATEKNTIAENRP